MRHNTKINGLLATGDLLENVEVSPCKTHHQPSCAQQRRRGQGDRAVGKSPGFSATVPASGTSGQDRAVKPASISGERKSQPVDLRNDPWRQKVEKHMTDTNARLDNIEANMATKTDIEKLKNDLIKELKG